jgi:gliding motility-associated-like protein
MADPATGYTYQWSPGTGLTNPNGAITNASPPETTTYTISIIDQDINGSCVLTDTVTIKVFEFVCGFPVSFLPNAFTPNGDGANDLLYVRGPYVESIHLAIYDRWGEKVFETFDKEIPWDGTYEGRELDPAVYVYHLTLNCIDGQETFEKGNITLTR